MKLLTVLLVLAILFLGCSSKDEYLAGIVAKLEKIPRLRVDSIDQDSFKEDTSGSNILIPVVVLSCVYVNNYYKTLDGNNLLEMKVELVKDEYGVRFLEYGIVYPYDENVFTNEVLEKLDASIRNEVDG